MRKKLITVLLCSAIIFSFIVIVIEIAPRVEAPTTIYVDDSNTTPPWLGTPGDPYQHIQDGINVSSDGDTVFVKSGTYYENVIVNRTINLTGEDKTTTIIDGRRNDDVVYVIANWSNITGFKITDSKTPSTYDGIRLHNVQYCRITNNIITSNDYGIRVDSSINNQITDNIVTANNGEGIYLSSSTDNNISKNNVSSNWDRGIYLYHSPNNNLLENNLTDDGIFIHGDQLSHFNTHLIPNNNKVNNKPLYYHRDIGNFNIDGIQIGQLILANCTNINVTNLNIDNTDYGMLIAYSKNIIIENNNVSTNNEAGIWLISTSNSKITGNNATNNFLCGIQLISSSDNNITDNNASNNMYDGISLSTSSENNIVMDNEVHLNSFADGIDVYWSNNNIIIGNNVSNNRFGIYLMSSHYNTIIGNNVSSNDWFGIRLGSGDYCEIIDNIVYLNSGNGIHLSSSSNDNKITGNRVLMNDVGINLTTASNNKVYHNNFDNNIEQAYDASNNNRWDDGYPSGGNYWSDYFGFDNYKGPYQNIIGSDGIGDTPYTTISGGSGAIDNYPLMKPGPRLLDNYTVLKQGWNLISIPLIQINLNLTKVLEMIDGYYDAVQWYDIIDTTDTWKHYRVGKPYGNDLFELHETMGFWIHITQPGETIFLYNGTQPTVNQTILLHPGWNLVGYPSLTNHNRTMGLNNLTFGSHIDSIWTYNSATQKWKEIGPSDYFEIGMGYWIHAKVECEWEVPL